MINLLIKLLMINLLMMIKGSHKKNWEKPPPPPKRSSKCENILTSWRIWGYFAVL